MSQMSRADHLAWAKARALEYLARGDTKNAVTSMLSDMRKHPECKVASVIEMLGMQLLMNDEHPTEVKRWINGFN